MATRGSTGVLPSSCRKKLVAFAEEAIRDLVFLSLLLFYSANASTWRSCVSRLLSLPASLAHSARAALLVSAKFRWRKSRPCVRSCASSRWSYVKQPFYRGDFKLQGLKEVGSQKNTGKTIDVLSEACEVSCGFAHTSSECHTFAFKVSYTIPDFVTSSTNFQAPKMLLICT